MTAFLLILASVALFWSAFSFVVAAVQGATGKTSWVSDLTCVGWFAAAALFFIAARLPTP